MESGKLAAQRAKDLLALCLASAIHGALSQQIGPFWFLEFSRIDQLEEDKRRITRPGQSSINDLDLQALLKILRFRDEYTDRVLEFYGFLNAQDPYATQSKKRQFRSLLDRLITDFRNQIEAHARVSDLRGGQEEQLYGYKEALQDMAKLSGIFKVVTDESGKSYHQQILQLTKPEKKRKNGWILPVVIAGLLIAGIAAAVLLWPKESAETPKKEKEAPTTGNVYYTENTPSFSPGELTIQPKHVYFDGDEIVASCFILNGTDTTLSNIHVETLIFSDIAEEPICGASFGEIKDMVLTPNHYGEWTFRFPASTIYNPEADLTALLTDAAFAYYGK